MTTEADLERIVTEIITKATDAVSEPIPSLDGIARAKALVELAGAVYAWLQALKATRVQADLVRNVNEKIAQANGGTFMRVP